jgi:integrase
MTEELQWVLTKYPRGYHSVSNADMYPILDWRKYSGMGKEVCLYEATRHSFGSQMIQHNDVSVVKELLGQSDVRSTEKYLHFKVAHLTEALDGRRQVIELVPKGKKEVKEK